MNELYHDIYTILLVRNCHSKVRKIPVKRRFYLRLGGSQKSLSVPFRHFPRQSDAGINPDLDTVPFVYK
jgi:hypothetical protein